MKVERFVKEYANYEINKLKESYKLYKNDVCLSNIEKINTIVRLREKRLITASEAVLLIAKG